MKKFSLSLMLLTLLAIPFAVNVSAETVDEQTTLDTLEFLLDDVETTTDVVTERTMTDVYEAVEDERLLIQIAKNTIVAKNNVRLTKEEVVRLKRAIAAHRASDVRLTDAQLVTLFEATLALRAEIQQPTYTFGQIAQEAKRTVQLAQSKRWISAHQSLQQIATLQFDQIAHFQNLHQPIRQMSNVLGY